MAISAKALVIMEKLKGELAQRLPALAQVSSSDTDSYPLLRIGAASPGATGALIKVRAQAWTTAVDALGLSQDVYTPHVIQVVIEANFAGTTDNVADVNTPATIHQIHSTLAGMGCRVELYSATNGGAPATSDIVAAKLVSTWDPLLPFGMIANQ